MNTPDLTALTTQIHHLLHDLEDLTAAIHTHTTPPTTHTPDTTP